MCDIFSRLQRTNNDANLFEINMLRDFWLHTVRLNLLRLLAGPTKAIEQLRGYETRRLIEAGSVLEHKFVPKVKATKKSKKSKAD